MSWLPGLVHEARHADIHIPHTCPTDQTKDAQTGDMGAYGVQYWLMMWVAEYSDASPETREWYGYAYRRFRFTAFCQECSNSMDASSVGSLFLSPNQALQSTGCQDLW